MKYIKNLAIKSSSKNLTIEQTTIPKYNTQKYIQTDLWPICWVAACPGSTGDRRGPRSRAAWGRIWSAGWSRPCPAGRLWRPAGAAFSPARRTRSSPCLGVTSPRPCSSPSSARECCNVKETWHGYFFLLGLNRLLYLIGLSEMISVICLLTDCEDFIECVTLLILLVRNELLFIYEDRFYIPRINCEQVNLLLICTSQDICITYRAIAKEGTRWFDNNVVYMSKYCYKITCHTWNVLRML